MFWPKLTDKGCIRKSVMATKNINYCVWLTKYEI